MGLGLFVLGCVLKGSALMIGNLYRGLFLGLSTGVPCAGDMRYTQRKWFLSLQNSRQKCPYWAGQLRTFWTLD
jgi:hypothetical protein